ncbi:PUA-like domain-containing protein [Cristinia sonorae]|uniref:PUA-like domain-containing protein n=1 Tax=Cristinia sonorae TaxID=1940300 RepID=A0A8K0UJA8_9AGAR|nr:PUA-like domain-containing protein [Cristinia sonorae]
MARTRQRRKKNSKSDVYGHIPGVPVGTTFASRSECMHSGVHPVMMAGIYGSPTDGAYSIVLSGGYEDDEDKGDTLTYTGMGGRQKKNALGKRITNGPQVSDQSFNHSSNRSLLTSYENGKPVRVTRGSQLNSIFAPAEGYRYDGLYRVTNAELERGKTGFRMCRFTLERIPGQDPLPVRYYSQTLAKLTKSSNGRSGQARKYNTKDRTRTTGMPSISAKDERRFERSPLQSMASLHSEISAVDVGLTAAAPSHSELPQPEAGPSGLHRPMAAGPSRHSYSPPIPSTTESVSRRSLSSPEDVPSYPNSHTGVDRIDEPKPLPTARMSVEHPTPVVNTSWQDGAWLFGRPPPRPEPQETSHPATSRTGFPNFEGYLDIMM